MTGILIDSLVHIVIFLCIIYMSHMLYSYIKDTYTVPIKRDYLKNEERKAQMMSTIKDNEEVENDLDMFLKETLLERKEN